MNAAFRPLWLLDSTAGERHIDATVRDCLDRRSPVAETDLRLMVAADVAAVLDRGQS